MVQETEREDRQVASAQAAQSMPSKEQMISDLLSGQEMPSREQMISDILGSQAQDTKVQEIARKQKERMSQRQKQVRVPAPEPMKPMRVQPKQEMDRFTIPELNEVILKEAGFDRDSELVVEAFKTDKMLKLPPGATLAQLYQESALDPNARSKAGALGIAQVIPATLKSLEERFGRKLNPRDPMDAIMMHRELMRENLAKFKSWEGALKAYNAGWDTRRWGKTAENREYVSRIKRWRNRIVGGNSNKGPSIKRSPLL